MKRQTLAPILATLALAMSTAIMPAHAQEIQGPAVAPGNTVLSVSAQGTASRKPDLAVFTAGVATTGETAAAALSANSAAMNRVIAALKRAGIAERDIQTSNLNLSPVYANREPRQTNTLEQQLPRIIGYRANNQVIVKQRDIAQYGKVIDTLVSAGANQVNGPSFQMDEPDAALDEARREAMTKARERAALYAGAAGLRVARILSITESGGYGPPRPVMYARMAADSAEAATPVEAGEIEMQANVQVIFELAP